MYAKYQISQNIIDIDNPLWNWKYITHGDSDGLKTGYDGHPFVVLCRKLQISVVYLWYICKALVDEMQWRKEADCDCKLFGYIQQELDVCIKNESMTGIAFKVLELGRLYIRLYAMRLSVDVRGLKLKVLDRCLESVTTKTTLHVGPDALKAWEDILIINKRLRNEFPHTNYSYETTIDLESFLDAPHTSENLFSNWISCTKG